MVISLRVGKEGSVRTFEMRFLDSDGVGLLEALVRVPMRHFGDDECLVVGVQRVFFFEEPQFGGAHVGGVQVGGHLEGHTG